MCAHMYFFFLVCAWFARGMHDKKEGLVVPPQQGPSGSPAGPCDPSKAAATHAAKCVTSLSYFIRRVLKRDLDFFVRVVRAWYV